MGGEWAVPSSGGSSTRGSHSARCLVHRQ
eukprot:symbB.v1.2.000829.t1/scaffold37.1/size397765/1